MQFLLIDISNSFTKIARSSGDRLGRVKRFPTPEVNPSTALTMMGRTPVDAVVISSVVPKREKWLLAGLHGLRVIRVGPEVELGVGIDYPEPETIGADRLANAAGAAVFFGTPCVVVDFGTAVTFDVVSAERNYIGGVIAPGLEMMTESLHLRTALLPKIDIREPVSAVGKSTRDAMRAGAVYGYRGMVRQILLEIRRAAFPGKRCKVVATGGYAELIAEGVPEIGAVDPLLTLQGLRIIGNLNA
jgi:type III pantothenate kinase